jgi:hypothetical protein
MSCPHGNHHDGCDICDELEATNRQVEILSDALAESRRGVAALKAVQEPVGRTDQQIVDQTEELAGFLMRAFHRREKADPLSTFRGTQDIRAQHCWQTACQIQEMLTATDPENAVAELDVDDTSPAAQRPWVDLTDEQRSAIIRHHSFADDIIRVTTAKLKELNT